MRRRRKRAGEKALTVAELFFRKVIGMYGAGHLGTMIVSNKNNFEFYFWKYIECELKAKSE